MATVQISLLMVISTLANIVKVYLRGMGITNGKMVIFIVVTLKRDLNTVRENGDKNHRILMNQIGSIISRVIISLM